jgi:membrane protease YdiL (CAAX protease family)
MVVPGLLLFIVFALLAQGVQRRLRAWAQGRPRRILAGPLLLTATFAAASWTAGAFSIPLALLVFGYTLAPTFWVLFTRSADVAAILMLWLPLEFSAGASLVPKPVQGYLHAVAYGVAIVLALWLFLICRGWKGMKYNLPRRLQDFINPLLGFAVLLPVLGGLGYLLGFLPPPHLPRFAWPKIGTRYLTIFCATALPEEILFRALMQNWLMQRFGATHLTLLASGVIFGCAHLNNGPQTAPNWRYMILASIAGAVFGRVFQKSSSILSSASLHALVNTVKYAFF